MPSIRDLLIGAVLPGAIVALVLGAAWLLLGRKPEKRPLPRWSAPVAFALAYLPADFAVRSWPQVWPADSTKRLVHMTLLLGAVGVATSLLRVGRFRGLIHGLALVAAMWLPLEALGRGGETGTMLIWIGVSAGAALAFAVLLGRESERRGGWATPAHGAMIAMAASPVLLFGRMAVDGQVAGGVVAMLTAAAIVGAVCKRLTLHAGGSLVIAGLLVGMLSSGHHFASVRWEAAALVLASPAVLWIDRLPALARRKVWQRFLIEAALLAIPLGAAAAIAFAHKPDYEYF